MRVLVTLLNNRIPGDKDVFISLGDRLWVEGNNVVAAHICYVMADVPVVVAGDSRIVLLGSDHKQDPHQFATPSAIQRTEIYNFSKKLANPMYINASVQPYRLLYAMHLADIGLVERAQLWLKDISSCV